MSRSLTSKPVIAACLAVALETAAAAEAPAPGPEQKLAAAGLRLPPADPPSNNFANAVVAGNMLFLAGHGECGTTLKLGKVGAELTLEEGRRSAERVALCMLASAKAEIGDLSRIERFVRIFGMSTGPRISRRARASSTDFPTS